jgi:predicted ribosomally synthesized peptide with nif11-like leader
MATDMVKAFAAKVRADVALRSRIQNDPHVDLVALGTQHGFGFTLEDIRAVGRDLKTSGELTDEQLQVLSGGTAVEYAAMLALIIVV